MGDVNRDAIIDVTRRRLEVVRALADGPRDKRALVAEVGCSRSTVDRGIDELTDHGLVRSTGGRYELTLFGQCLLELREGFQETVAELIEQRGTFEATVTTEFLSPDLLVGAEVSAIDQTVPFYTTERITSLSESADRARVAISALDSAEQFEQLHRLVVDEQGSLELLTTPLLLNRLCEAFETELSEMARSDRFRLVVTDGFDSCLRCLSGEAGERVVLTVRDEDGRPHSLLTNDRPRAVAAGKAALDEYMADGTDVTDAITQPGLSPEDVCTAGTPS